MTLPLILVVDDVYFWNPEKRQEFLEQTNNIEISLDAIFPGNGDRSVFEKKEDKLAAAVFCSGQRVENNCATNDYQVIKEVVSRAWGERTDLKWSLILLDVMFDSGPLSATKNRPIGMQPGDQTFGLTVRNNLLQDFPGLPIITTTSKAEEEIITDDSENYLSKTALHMLPQKLILRGNLTISQIRKILSLDDGKIIVGSNYTMKTVFFNAFLTAKDSQEVLLLGETGVGKEVVAKYIHRLSSRRNNKFVGVNINETPRNLIPSLLFGHEKGSFTGASIRQIGVFEEANTGTLFLDEIGDVPLSVQAQLLRALEERTIKRIGGRQGIPTNIRLVSATSMNLHTMIEKGKFREDLLYRINGCTITIPPLRDRRDEIIPMAEHFLSKYMARTGKIGIILDEEAKAELLSNPFKGNVRQLKNLIRRIVAVKGNYEIIRPHELRQYLYYYEQNKGVTQPHEIRNQRPDGLPVSYIDNSDVLDIQDFINMMRRIDIKTDREKLHGSLLKLQEEHRLLLRRLVGAALKCTYDGRYKYSAAMRILLGIERETVGRHQDQDEKKRVSHENSKRIIEIKRQLLHLIGKKTDEQLTDDDLTQFVKEYEKYKKP